VGGHAALSTEAGEVLPDSQGTGISVSDDDGVDDHAVLSSEEEDVLPDNQGTGISVSDDNGVDFGIVERNGLNGQFGAPSYSITINHAKGFPAVTFVEARIRSWDGSDSR